MNSANIITVLHNNAGTLKGFLEGIKAQESAVARVVIVDNASTDQTLATARQLAESSGLDVVVVENTNDGFAGGYARGGRERLDFSLPTLCLNPDVELAPGTLTRMLGVFEDLPDAGIVTAPLIMETGEPDSASRRLLPTVGKASIYAVLGRLTPKSMRYNKQGGPVVSEVETNQNAISLIEATTGALMLVHPRFRTADQGIFDRDYWMYGEDLQLCVDARNAGWKVAMSEGVASRHHKGTSSGRPRSRKSNIEFHRAMYIYYTKNLNTYLVGKLAVGSAIYVRLGFELLASKLIRTANTASSGFSRRGTGAAHD